MRAKNINVNIVDINEYLKGKHRLLDELWKRYGADELVITSGRDGKHSAGSLHAVGMAEDYRLWNLPNMTIQVLGQFLADLEAILPDAPFDVLMEWAPLHIHAEFDPHPPEQKIALRLASKKFTPITKPVSIILPELKIELGLLHDIMSSDAFRTGSKVIKIGANVVGQRYAGINVFEVKESGSIYSKLRKLIELIITKLTGQKA